MSNIEYGKLFEMRMFNKKLLSHYFDLQKKYHSKQEIIEPVSKIIGLLESDNILKDIKFEYVEILTYFNEFLDLHFRYLKYTLGDFELFYESRKKLIFTILPFMFDSINKLITAAITSSVNISGLSNIKHNETCGICMEDNITLFPVYCGNNHYYCKLCIRQFCKQKNCPSCRSLLYSKTHF